MAMNRMRVPRRRGRDRRPEKKKRCKLCGRKVEVIDYKDVDLISSFMTERAKMVPRRTSGNCAKHQRILARAIKRARTMALVPYNVD